MVPVKTKAIVLGFIKYGESSIIAKLFTRDLGLISVIVKGVRKVSKHSKANLYQSMNILEIVLNNKPNVKLHYLKDSNRCIQFVELPFDHVKRSSALFLTEVVSKCIQEHQIFEEFYDFLEHKLLEIDQMKRTDKNVLIFSLLEITQLIGFYPLADNDGDYFNLKDGYFSNHYSSFTLDKLDSDLFRKILTAINKSKPLEITHDERIRFIDLMLTYFELHIEQFGKIKSLEVIREL